MPAPLPANEAQRLEALRRYQILDTPAEPAFDDFAILASTICQTPVAVLTFLDRDRQWLKASVGAPHPEKPRDDSFCSYAILRDEVMVVEDTRRDPRFSNNPYVTADGGTRFYAGAPLIDAGGMALGAICVLDCQPRQLSPEQCKALEALARQIILQLEFRRTSADLAEALTQIKTLRGLLPMCAHCKGIRDDLGFWQSVESYVSAHSDADFSHGICPDCLQEQHPEVYAALHAKGQI